MSQNNSFLTLLPPFPYLPLSERHGELPFALTNDCMFKTLFQSEGGILRALLCSLLDLTPADIRSLIILNPFVPGTTIERKDSILDLRLNLNNNSLINLEMQLKNERNWSERSLCYLCRTFDNLEKGASYLDVKPAHHIGILNFSMPHVRKQFYSHYYVTNETTKERLSDKFRLSVLDLTQTALATEHDRQAGLIRWAAAFKAATWEDFQMLAEEDALFQKVSDALYLISENRELAEQCRRMQEAEALREYQEALNRKREARLAEQETLLAEQKSALTEKDQALARKEEELEQLRAQLRAYQEQSCQE